MMGDDSSDGILQNEYTEAGNTACSSTIAELDLQRLPSRQSPTMVASEDQMPKKRVSSQGLDTASDIEAFIDKLLSIGEDNLYHWRRTSSTKILERKDVPSALEHILIAATYVNIDWHLISLTAISV